MGREQRIKLILAVCLVVFIAGCLAAVVGIQSDSVIVDRGTSTCPVLGGGTMTTADGLVLDQRDPRCADATKTARLIVDLGVVGMGLSFVAAGVVAWRAHRRELGGPTADDAGTVAAGQAIDRP